MMMAFGEVETISFVTDSTILMLVLSRSSRLMPGFRAIPDVITTTSEPALSS